MARVNISSFFLFSLVNLVFLFNSVKCNVPVLLWESATISDKDDLIPALFQLDSDEFSNHLVKKVQQHHPLVVLFLEESLSVEDFSWKDVRGQGSFPLLQNVTATSAKTEFISSVYDPVAALKDLDDSQDYSWIKYDGKKLPVKSRVVLEVRLEDPSADEDRPELLRRHDRSIAAIYSKLLSQYSHIVAIFTGKYSSWVEPEYNRVKRETEDNNSTFELSTKFADGKYAMIVSSKAPVLTGEDGESISLGTPFRMFPDSKKGQIGIVANFPDKTHLRFMFSENNGFWKLQTVTLNETITLTSPTEISKPIGSPYVAEGPIEFSKGNIKLKFMDITIQPYSQQLKFGESSNVYFTIPILMGIFMTVILGAVLSWAIVMMMDIRTMDRFDDPKGKMITVAQGE